MVRCQNPHWILGGFRGHLNDVVQLINDVSGGGHSQSPIRTLIQHSQLEKLMCVCRYMYMYMLQYHEFSIYQYIIM